MIHFLLNNSITIIFLAALFFVGRSEYRRYLQRKGLSSEAFKSRLQKQLVEVGTGLSVKLLTSVIVTIIISTVSFRELFIPDVFHTVFLTMMLVRPVHSQLKKLIE